MWLGLVSHPWSCIRIVYAAFAASLVTLFFRDVPSSSYPFICLTFLICICCRLRVRIRILFTHIDSDSHQCSRKHVDEENSYDLIGVRQHQPARRVSRRAVPLRLIGFSVLQFRLASFISASGSAARAPHTTLISASGDSVLRRFG